MSVQALTTHQHGTILEGHVLRVERKQVRECLRPTGSAIARAAIENAVPVSTTGIRYRSVTSPIRGTITPALLPPERTGAFPMGHGLMTDSVPTMPGGRPRPAPLVFNPPRADAAIWGPPDTMLPHALRGLIVPPPAYVGGAYSPFGPMPMPPTPHGAPPIPFAHHHPYYTNYYSQPYGQPYAGEAYKFFPPPPPASFGSPVHAAHRAVSFAGSPTQKAAGGPTHGHEYGELMTTNHVERQMSRVRLDETPTRGPIRPPQSAVVRRNGPFLTPEQYGRFSGTQADAQDDAQAGVVFQGENVAPNMRADEAAMRTETGGLLYHPRPGVAHFGTPTVRRADQPPAEQGRDY